MTLRVVRSGITRTVILIGPWAIKVPTGRGTGLHAPTPRGRVAGVCRGLLANQSEQTWHRFEPWSGMVAPVIRSWLFGLVQVYPRCVPLADGDRGPLPRLDPCPGDVKPDNFGRWRGRVVRLDYDMS